MWASDRRTCHTDAAAKHPHGHDGGPSGLRLSRREPWAACAESLRTRLGLKEVVT